MEATGIMVRALRPDGTVEPGALGQAAATAPGLSLVVLFQGMAHPSDGDYAAAAQSFRAVLDRPYSGSYYDALLGLARIAEAEGNTVEAISWIDEARRVNPYHARHTWNMPASC